MVNNKFNAMQKYVVLPNTWVVQLPDMINSCFSALNYLITSSSYSDEPGKPGKPNIDDWDNTMVLLKWAPPESDGGRPITHYVVELKDKFAFEWTEAMKTEDNKPEAKVTGLKENMTYQFRVRAVNIAGPSEPSEATPNHVVKHRNRKSIVKIYCRNPYN